MAQSEEQFVTSAGHEVRAVGQKVSLMGQIVISLHGPAGSSTQDVSICGHSVSSLGHWVMLIGQTVGVPVPSSHIVGWSDVPHAVGAAGHCVGTVGQ